MTGPVARGEMGEMAMLGLLVCVLSLAGSLSGAGQAPVSLVIQGSGGTGKTKIVINSVKDIVWFICSETENEMYRQGLFLAALNKPDCN